MRIVGVEGFTWAHVTERMMTLVLKQWREDRISWAWFTSYQSDSNCPLLRCPHDHLHCICYRCGTKSSTQQKINFISCFHGEQVENPKYLMWLIKARHWASSVWSVLSARLGFEEGSTPDAMPDMCSQILQKELYENIKCISRIVSTAWLFRVPIMSTKMIISVSSLLSGIKIKKLEICLKALTWMVSFCSWVRHC